MLYWHRYVRSRALLASLLFICCADGIAQQSAASAAQLEEITVTAQRRVESLQDVPISVTAFSSAELDARGIVDLGRLQGFVPNLVIEPPPAAPGSSSVFLRGLGQDAASIDIDPGVSLYVDDVYVARQVGGLVDLYDIERIEVLRGPQGTLYGRNSTGGAIKVIANAPELGELDGGIELGFGNFDQRTARGFLNAPIGDRAAARLAVSWRDRGNFTENLTPGGVQDAEEVSSARAAVRFEPNDALDITLSGLLTRVDGTPSAASNFDSPAGPDDRDTVSNRLDLQSDYDTDQLSINARWSLGDSLAIVSITGYRELSMRLRNDADATVLPLIETDQLVDQDQFSQELQLVYGADRLDAVFGLFYFDEAATFRDDTAPSFSDYEQLAESFAVFSQATFNVTDALALTAGVRWTSDEKRVSGVQPVVAQMKASEEKVTWRAAVDYEVVPGTLLYVSASTGFKSGAFPSTIGFREVEPEEVTTYEAGVKSELFDRRLIVNASYFDSDFENYQAIYFAPTAISAFQYFNSDAQYSGFELELRALPIPALELFGSLATMDSELTEPGPGLTAATGIQAGARMRQTPELQWALGGTYTVEMASAGSLSLTASARHSDDWFTGEANTPDLLSGDFTVIDARLAWQSADGRWSANLAGQNLTDETYQTGGFDLRFIPIPGVGRARFYNPPRSWMAMVGYRF